MHPRMFPKPGVPPESQLVVLRDAAAGCDFGEPLGNPRNLPLREELAVSGRALRGSQMG